MRDSYSPVNRRKRGDSDSPVNRRKRGDSDSLVNTHQRRESNSPVDRRKGGDSDNPFNRRKRSDFDSPVNRHKRRDSNIPVNRRKRGDSDSPVNRHRRRDSDSPVNRQRRRDSNSPVNRLKRRDSNSPVNRRKRRDSDSPVNRHKRGDSNSPVNRRKRRDSDSPVKRLVRRDSDSPVIRCKRRDSDSPVNRHERWNLDNPTNRRGRQISYSPVIRHKRRGSHSPVNRRAKQDANYPINIRKRLDSGISITSEYGSLSDSLRQTFGIPINRNEKLDTSLSINRQRQDSDSSINERESQDSDNTYTADYDVVGDSIQLQRNYSRRLVRSKNIKDRRHTTRTISVGSVTTVNVFENGDKGSDSVSPSAVDRFKNCTTTYDNILKTTDKVLKQHKTRGVSVRKNYRALNLAYSKLSENSVLIITGHPGIGKTFLGCELLNYINSIEKDHPHYQWKRPIILHNPWDWSTVVSPAEDVVVFLDDIFGNVILNQTKVANWEQNFDSIWTCANSGLVLVVMAMRKYILKEYRSNRNHHLFQEKHLLDLSSDPKLDLNPEIKSIMFTKHLLEPVHSLRYQIEVCDTRQKENWTSSPYKISKEFISEVVQLPNECPVPGSPLKYKLFSQEEEFLTRGKEFFERPIACLKQLFLSFYSEERLKFLLLAAVWFSGEAGLQRSVLKPTNLTDYSRIKIDDNKFEKGQVTVTTIHRFADLFGVDKKDLVTIIDAESCMKECFLVVDFEKDVLQFSHKAIGEAVCLALGTKYLDLVINDCSLDLLLKYVQTEETATKEYNMTLTSITEYKMLAQRFYIEIEKGHPREVMTHPVLTGSKFLATFESMIKEKINNMYQYSEFMRICQHGSTQGILYFSVDQIQPKLSFIQYLLKNSPREYHGCLPRRGKVPKWFENQKEEALLAACRRGHFQAYKALMNSKTNHQTRKLLLDIAKGNSRKIADNYFKSNKQVSLDDKMTALHAACEYGSHFVFDVLLEHIHGVKELKNIALLVAACKGGHIGIVSFFAADVNPNQYHEKSTPLMEAVLGGHDYVVEYLLERGATLNVPCDSDNIQDFDLIDHAKNLGFKNIVTALEKHKQQENTTVQGRNQVTHSV